MRISIEELIILIKIIIKKNNQEVLLGANFIGFRGITFGTLFPFDVLRWSVSSGTWVLDWWAL